MRLPVQRLFLPIACMLLCPPASADGSLPSVTRTAGNWRLSGSGYSVVFSGATGAILSVSGATHGSSSIISSGEQGLWAATLAGGTTIVANSPAGGVVRIGPAAKSNALVLNYAGPELDVRITATPRDHAVDLQAAVAPVSGTLVSFSLPGRLRFAPDRVRRFISPMPAAESVGAEFTGRFFALQPLDPPEGYEPAVAGPGPYRSLYGGPLNMLPADAAPAPLQVTADGREWLGPAAAALDGRKRVVNRAPAAGQADLILADSPNGPYLSASHLGGAGWLWRIAESGDEAGSGILRRETLQILSRLASPAPPGRTRIGLIDLDNGPQRGSWTPSTVADWRMSLSDNAFLKSRGLQIDWLTSAASLFAALRSSDYLAVVNPYGEYAPVPRSGSMDDTIDAVREYVRAGGNWFETGGYPFYYALAPIRYFHFDCKYPSLFADFFYLDTTAGTASVYRVQPARWPPFAGSANHDDIFAPGEDGMGGDRDGGYLDRSLATFVPAGSAWTTPVCRIAIGGGDREQIAAYAAANGIDRPLSAKMPAGLLQTFAKSVLVKFDGSCQDQIAHLRYLPRPSLVHFSDYLHGGFDKQYPDILPPNPAYATSDEFRTLLRSIRDDGMLAMPYTNTSWWCDHPRGPTFLRDGEAPLSRKADGSLYYEKYAANDGFAVTFWHPAVQAADKRDVQLFSSDYPIDILFQDQVGARTWIPDYNPSSPTPYAYAEGLISLSRVDAAMKPLATENGWDRVINSESEFCGMSWDRLEFPPDEYAIYPLAEYMAHDKLAFVEHDLGQSANDSRTVAKLLGLGFGFTYREAAANADVDSVREWLLWLGRVQSSVCARYTGQPLISYAYTRAHDDNRSGVIRAVYGPVRIVANLTSQALTDGAWTIAPSGFRASANVLDAGDAVSAANPQSSRGRFGFVLEGSGASRDLWIYAPRGQDIVLPISLKKDAALVWDGESPARATIRARALETITPPANARQSDQAPALTCFLWHARLSGF